MWKTLQDKTKIRNQSWRDLEKVKTERSHQSKGKWRKTYDENDGSVDSIRQERELYIAEDNKDADGSVDSIIYCIRQ